MTTGYLWDRGWNVVNEEDGSGALTRRYVLGSPRARVARTLGFVEGSTWQYLTQDHLGNTRGMWDANKALASVFDYTPYGEPDTQIGAIALSYGGPAFTGKPWDAVAGLYYFPYRQYNPDLGRWMTRDPLGMVDGPNVWAYVKNNPIYISDKLGLKTAEECGADLEECEKDAEDIEGGCANPGFFLRHMECLAKYTACLAYVAGENVCEFVVDHPVEVVVVVIVVGVVVGSGGTLTPILVFV